MNDQSSAAVRASINFPSEVYKTLEIFVREKKVSLAWVVREEAENYIDNKGSLLKGQG